jgi:hypothetical protein
LCGLCFGPLFRRRRKFVLFMRPRHGIIYGIFKLFPLYAGFVCALLGVERLSGMP